MPIDRRAAIEDGSAMFPFRDHNPTRRLPVVTLGLIVLNVALHIHAGAAHPSPLATWGYYEDWALLPWRLSRGEALAGLVTYQFLHADYWHLGANMLILWIYGDNLEEALGRVGFLVFYLTGGVLAGLAQWAVSPWSLVPVLGASGAIAAVMGGYLLLWPRARIDVLIFLVIYARVVTVSVWIIMVLWLTVQVLGGLGLDAAGANIAHAAHLGGFAAGVVLALPLWLWRGGPAGWRESHGHPPHAPSFTRRPERERTSPWG